MAENIKFYKTILGEWFAVELCADPIDKVYFSSDGISFMRLYVAGYSSSNRVITNFSVDNPHDGYNWSGRFKFNGEIFVLEREDSPHRPVFRPADPHPSCEFVPLPHIVELKGLYQMPDGKFLFWTGARYDFNRKDVRFYFGEIDCLKEYKVYSFDGSLLETSAGNLSVHSAGFEGYRLKVLEHKEFEVEIDGQKIRLVRKKKENKK